MDRTVGDPSPDTKYKNTEAVTKTITDLGYNLEVMWECTWKAKVKADKIIIPDTYYYPTEHEYRMSEAKILQHIKDGKIFGAVEVDMEVPDHLKDFFKEFPPIFKNTSVITVLRGRGGGGG